MKFHCLTAALLLSAALALATNAPKPMYLLRNFKDSTASPQWIAQNDGVMGGVSTGRAELKGGVLHFHGVLSLENNGGFAQVYSPVTDGDFSNYKAVRLRVKGDGRTYQFRLATDARFRGSRIAYRATFPTEAGEWNEVTMPLDDFQPSYRGRILSGPELDLTSVREIALLLSDGRAGRFHLQIEWIGME